jgi:quinate/shikimate dehydrogenase (NAD+)
LLRLLEEHAVSAIRLGLIGDNIATSRAPELHRVAGRLCGIEVTYDLLIPKNLGFGFESVFDRARREGYRGLNITYPYKEAVIRRLEMQDKSIRLIGACNTVLFEPSGPAGANTDFTGFLVAYRNTFETTEPGIVALAGCGGVGRAVSFALVQLGARGLHLFDANCFRSESLAEALSANAPFLEISVAKSIYQACEGADGLVNCTPLGMAGFGGSAFPAELFAKRIWAFDAVYTPVETPFLQNARAAGLLFMSGYELFLSQGVDAFRSFTGQNVDESELRRALTPSFGIS